MEKILHHAVELSAGFVIPALELIGIAIIVIGTLKALFTLITNGFNFHDSHIKIVLGEALALSLEFKLGSEIIKTVVVRDMQELLILGIIVVLRVMLTFVIHWEVAQAGEKHSNISDLLSNKKNNNL
ncbi:DUF1622 domain-containing protein [Peptoniphilaceae bacterium SGI.131]